MSPATDINLPDDETDGEGDDDSLLGSAGGGLHHGVPLGHHHGLSHGPPPHQLPPHHPLHNHPSHLAPHSLPPGLMMGGGLGPGGPPHSCGMPMKPGTPGLNMGPSGNGNNIKGSPASSRGGDSCPLTGLGGGGNGGPESTAGSESARQCSSPGGGLLDDDTSSQSGHKRRGPRTTIKAKQLETLKNAFAATPKVLY